MKLFPSFVFFGTDEFATAVLKELASAKIFPSNDISKADLGLVASYGKIIPPTIFNLPKYGTLNIHPSLLPKYRGPTPIQSAILNDDKETGVTLMLLDAELDHGSLLQTRTYKLKAKSFPEVRNDLAKLGAELFLTTAPLWVAGKIKAVPQNHTLATYTKKIKKEDGEINFSQGDTFIPQGVALYQKFLAYYGWPGSYFFVERNRKRVRVIITAAHLADNQFIIDRVKPEGKKDMLYTDFLRGFK
jgi:methionyl-tRNA formyltransferase